MDAYFPSFTWTVTDFSTSKIQRSSSGQQSDRRSDRTRSSTQRSPEFLAGGCKWALKLKITRYGSGKYVNLDMDIPDYLSLPKGWNRKARVYYSIINPPPPLSRQDVKAVDFHAGNREDCLLYHHGPLEENAEFKATRRLLIHVKVSRLVASGKSETVVNAPVLPLREVECSSSSSVDARVDHSPIVQESVLSTVLSTPCIEILRCIIESMSKSEISKEDLEIITAAVGHLKSKGMKNLDKLNTLSEKIAEEARESTLTLHKLFI